MYTEGKKTLAAGEALAKNRRVKLSGATLVYSDAEDFIGVTEYALANGEYGSYRDKKDPGTIELTAAAAITAGARIYPTTDGKVTATPNGRAIGFAIAAATADGDIIECVLCDDSLMGLLENKTVTVIAVDTNAAVTDSGTMYLCLTDAKTLTLPATAAGLKFGLVNIGADAAAGIAVDFQAADKNIGGCGVAAGGDGKKLTNTKATAKYGDFMLFSGDGGDGYRIDAYRGTWAQEP